MIIKETNNIEEIKSILCNPEIFDKWNEKEDRKTEDVFIPLEGIIYTGGYVKGKIIALSIIHTFMDGLKLHVHILKNYRLSHGREFVERTVSMLKSNTYLEIPENRKDIFNLARKSGFDSVENNKDSTNHKILMRLA